jgi:hypothetical protein
MNSYADKTPEIEKKSVVNEGPKKPIGGSVFHFANDRPDAVSQRKRQEKANNGPRATQMKAFQEMANNGPQAIQMKVFQKMANNSHPEKLAVQPSRKTGEDVVQLVEAGEQPIRVNSGDLDHTLTISGLINCVGVVIMIYGEGGQEFDYVAVVGGHFVTPTMYQFGNEEGFTEAGEGFLTSIRALIEGIDPGRLEPTFYIKEPAVEGANPESLVQATAAATAIRDNLGIGGSIQQVADNISVSV